MLAALCLAAGALTVSLPATHFTLRWQHSIEKIWWEEDYALAGPWLVITGARIRGSGAGMDPPDGAWLDHGVDLAHFSPGGKVHPGLAEVPRPRLGQAALHQPSLRHLPRRPPL